MGLKRFFQKRKFTDSASYWEKRYAAGGTSGEGSYGELAAFKAQVLNDFVASSGVRSIIEFGCGDGNQLKLAIYPAYVGFDVSATAVGNCRRQFMDDSTKRFELTGSYRGEQAELALSLDVIYHLVEDRVYEQYMTRLFEAATRFVIIYSNDVEGEADVVKPHVRFRKFSNWVGARAPGWELRQIVANPHRAASPADFFIYARRLGDATY